MMDKRFSWRIAAIALACLASAAPANAQPAPDCSGEALNRQPTLDAMLALARRCVDQGYASALTIAGQMVEVGYRDSPPDWRLATEIYEEIVNRTEPMAWSTLGARRWQGVLQTLAEKFEDGSGGTGWPQDFERAWQFQARMVNRMSRETSVTPEEMTYVRTRLAELEAKRDLSRRRSGRWTDDIGALSRDTIYAQRSGELATQRLQAEGFAGIIRAIHPHEPEDLPLLGYDFDVDVYSARPLGSEYAGLCLVLRNADDPALADYAMGMMYQPFGTPPVRQSSGPYQGWYRLSPKGGTTFAPIPWARGSAATSIRYEFRPVTDARLCTLDM
jgi:hypothetical protein